MTASDRIHKHWMFRSSPILPDISLPQSQDLIAPRLWRGIYVDLKIALLL